MGKVGRIIILLRVTFSSSSQEGNGTVREDCPFQGHKITFRRTNGIARKDDPFQGLRSFYSQERNLSPEPQISTLKMEAACSPETSVSARKTIRYHNPGTKWSPLSKF
jgi:hypothetical protein